MKYAIFSDVHANPTALKRVVADALSCGAEEFICLGDTVGYGPLPSEAIASVRSIARIVLSGNHDAAVSGAVSASNFIDLAGEAASRHRQALSRDELVWLRSLPDSANIAEAAFVHGDLTDPKAFNYVDSEDVAAANFAATDAKIVFVGHTHVPELFVVGKSGAAHRLAPQDFVREDGKRYIVNVGSVGYPRESNGTCRSSYVIYDTDEQEVRFRFLPFSVASVMQRGAAPTHRIAKTLVLTALAAGAAIAATMVFLARHRDAKSDRAPIAGQPAPASLIAEKTLSLEQGCRSVKPNLKIDGAAVKLDVAFFDDSGEVVVGGASFPVKRSCKKKFNVPPGARKAIFSIRRIREDKTTQILLFDPEAIQ